MGSNSAREKMMGKSARDSRASRAEKTVENGIDMELLKASSPQNAGRIATE
jgi:hypothetical protein